jgi:glycosyltransferase involved in cell wall biosynthesis
VKVPAAKIVHIIPTLVRGGAEKQLALLAAGLRAAGWNVEVCALTHGGPWAAYLEQAGVPYTVLGKRFKVDPLAWWRLVRYLRRARPQLVQTWLFAANSYGRTAALAAQVPVIVASERSSDPWKASHEFALDRWLARYTQRIVVNSSGVRDFYVEHGLPAEKFTIIPNAVEPAPPCAMPRAELLRSLGLPAEAKIILAVNRLWPQKRVQDLIWAADLLKVVRDDVRLLIVGEGPQRARLERFCRQIEVQDRVHFLGDRPDVPQLLAHSELLWLASGYEGLPNAVLEAMAAGVPVVATDLPGTRDLVVPGVTGYLVPVGDRAGLAREALRLIETPELARRLGQAARERAARHFSLQAMLERYATLYSDLLRSID